MEMLAKLGLLADMNCPTPAFSNLPTDYLVTRVLMKLLAIEVVSLASWIEFISAESRSVCYSTIS